MLFQKELIRSLRDNGERTAIESEGNTLSYARVLALADRVTRFLLGQHLGPQAFVGVQLANREDLICAMIGVMNARCIFVPIDASLPPGRRAAVLAELDLACLVVPAGAPGDGQAPALPRYCFEDLTAEPGAGNLADGDYPAWDADDSLYVYFTSGTTGRPKGIVGRNESLLQFLQWELDAFGIDASFRCSQFVSPYFDAFLRDVFVPLLAGATLCIPPAAEDFFTPGQMTPWLDQVRIHLVHCVPSLFRVMNHPAVTAGNYPALRYVLLSGERIVPAALVNWYDVFGERVQLVNLYGSTETTMIRFCYRIRPADTQRLRIPVGAPIAGTEFLVAAQGMKPCGKLVTGDLYVISRYVSKGYLNDPDLNARLFFPVTTPGLGPVTAFRTGDKARILADGLLDLVGREDRQVKRQGVRIELDEIESILGQSDHIARAVVITQPVEGGDDVLLAFIQPAGRAATGQDAGDAIRQFAADHLPRYMVPARLIEVDQYPLLPNGKMDYQALLQAAAAPTAPPPGAPGDEVEQRLLGIWKEILGDKPIALTDSFHSLGGNSLGLMRLVGRIYSEYSIRIPLNELFRNLTIRTQAVLVRKLNKDKSLLIKPASVKPAYVLSSAQERIYFNYQVNRGSTAFNIPMAWQIEGNADDDRLEQVLQRLIERHEGLRTRFEYAGARVVQVPLDRVDFTLERISAGGRSLEAVIAGFVRPFDLGQAPLIRGAVVEAGDGRKLLLVDVHHIACDGISQANLFSDFLRLYSGEPLAALKVQYKDYAEWEDTFRKTDEYIALRSFWLAGFEDELPRLALPSLNAARNPSSHAGGNVKFMIPKERFAPVLSRLAKDQVSVYAGMFSLFFAFLSKITGQDDIVVGTNTAGRVQAELDKVVGMFVKTLPIRYRLDLRVPFPQFARSLHDYLVEAMSKQAYDYADMVSELNRNREAPVGNLFEAMFVFRNFDFDRVPTQGVTFTAYHFENETAKYPITLFADEDDATFNFRFEYAASCFTPADVEWLIGQYRALVDAVAGNPDGRLLDLLAGTPGPAEEIEENISFNL